MVHDQYQIVFSAINDKSELSNHTLELIIS